jgi:hypothetical protein
MAMTILVEVTGNSRSGIAAKSQKPYCMFEAFVHLPNVPYPQKTSFYAQAQNEVPQAGTYECDVVCDVVEGRLSMTIDPRQGRRKNVPPMHAAKSAGV